MGIRTGERQARAAESAAEHAKRQADAAEKAVKEARRALQVAVLSLGVSAMTAFATLATPILAQFLSDYSHSENSREAAMKLVDGTELLLNQIYFNDIMHGCRADNTVDMREEIERHKKNIENDSIQSIADNRFSIVISYESYLNSIKPVCSATNGFASGPIPPNRPENQNELLYDINKREFLFKLGQEAIELDKEVRLLKLPGNRCLSDKGFPFKSDHTVEKTVCRGEPPTGIIRDAKGNIVP